MRRDGKNAAEHKKQRIVSLSRGRLIRNKKSFLRKQIVKTRRKLRRSLPGKNSHELVCALWRQRESERERERETRLILKG